MNQYEKTSDLLIAHYQKYPKLQIQDIFKFIYQSSFGCEHMVTSLDGVTAYILKEFADCSVPLEDNGLLDKLDGVYSRVHLGWLNRGLSAETLGKLFFASAKKEPEGMKNLLCKLETAKELVRENILDFPQMEFDAAAEEWGSGGYPAIHHSEAFRSVYHPAYRVVADRYVDFLQLFAEIDKLIQKGSAVIAIEGGSASGKTTLSGILSEIYDCTVFHMDDFFLRPEQRTAKRFAEPGGNIDRERFLEEVLIPLKNGKPIQYRRFDCGSMKIAPAVQVVPQKLTVIEGAYSMHPELADIYDLSVFLDVSSAVQKARIQKRNSPELARRFHEEWIPMEKLYFSEMDVKNRCSLILSVTE
ncbi:MAG: hypothetical protein IKJ99_01715 [Oscillospiraceae bacterium]|nr:hypothetical protein [Oscillospiraceae bacterium]